MRIIEELYIHHSGGLGNDPYASSRHLTLANIDKAHEARWPDFKSSLGYFVGYTVVIFPDGKVVQTRKLGEETAAVKGYNTNTISICLIGNFNYNPRIGTAVDACTYEQQAALKKIILALIERRPGNEGLVVMPDVILDIKANTTYPHRYRASTDCYGTSIKDTWARDIFASVIGEKLTQIQKLLYNLFLILSKMRNAGRMGAPAASCIDSCSRG